MNSAARRTFRRCTDPLLLFTCTAAIHKNTLTIYTQFLREKPTLYGNTFEIFRIRSLARAKTLELIAPRGTFSPLCVSFETSHNFTSTGFDLFSPLEGSYGAAPLSRSSRDVGKTRDARAIIVPPNLLLLLRGWCQLFPKIFQAFMEWSGDLIKSNAAEAVAALIMH